jgi:hypothetical protein
MRAGGWAASTHKTGVLLLQLIVRLRPSSRMQAEKEAASGTPERLTRQGGPRHTTTTTTTTRSAAAHNRPYTGWREEAGRTADGRHARSFFLLLAAPAPGPTPRAEEAPTAGGSSGERLAVVGEVSRDRWAGGAKGGGGGVDGRCVST